MYNNNCSGAMLTVLFKNEGKQSKKAIAEENNFKVP